MSDTDNLAWIPSNFLALPPENCGLEEARLVLIPVPYDSTTSFRGGARNGPAAIIEASYGLEDYDNELDSDVSQVGIHTTSALEPHFGGPVEMVQRGEVFFPAEVSQLVLQEYVGETAELDKPRLSVREREVLVLIAEGYTSKAIAHELSVSVRTVESHRENIMSKLDLHSIAGLTKYAIARGLVALK